jgi:uncharacterized protein YaaN involved in tellurite resistance
MKIHWFRNCHEEKYCRTLAELDATVMELKMKLKILTQRNHELDNLANDLRKENKSLEGKLLACESKGDSVMPQICKTTSKRPRGLLKA